MMRIWFLILAGAALVFFIAARVVLPLLGTAILIAYLLYPFVEWVHQRLLRGRARGVASLLVLLLTLAILIGAILPLLLSTAGQATSAFATLAPTISRIFQEPLVIENVPITDENGHPVILAEALDRWMDISQVESLAEQDMGLLWNSINYISRTTLSLFSQFLGGLLQAILGGLLFFFIIFYLLQEWRFNPSERCRIGPDDYQSDIERLLHDLGKVWHSFLRGQLILAIIMGASMCLLPQCWATPSPLLCTNCRFDGICAEHWSSDCRCSTRRDCAGCSIDNAPERKRRDLSTAGRCALVYHAAARGVDPCLR